MGSEMCIRDSGNGGVSRLDLIFVYNFSRFDILHTSIRRGDKLVAAYLLAEFIIRGNGTHLATRHV